MAHRFQFTVEVDLERESGKFATRDGLADELRTWLEDADQGEVFGVGADGESTYTVTSWSVDDA